MFQTGPWEPPPAPPVRGGPQPCLGAPPQLQYFYCFTFLILKIIIYISMIKCHGQPHVAREGILCGPQRFLGFLNNLDLRYLGYLPVFKGARLGSEHIPLKRT